MASPLFILEMANNHMGSVEHGLRLIREFGAVVREFPFRFAFKLQYRELNSFVHPDYRNRTDLRYIKRFLDTQIEEADFRRLVDEMHIQGFMPICTAFDEASVGRIEDHGFESIKIASCSFTDWPLLERIAKSTLPIIASTAGASLDDMDKVVSFFEHRGRPISLMHCVGEYPAPTDHLNLNQIDLLIRRYPRLAIGFSTHEPPTDTAPIRLAIAKGASLFEKHVGVPTPEWPVNTYSATPEQVRDWLTAAQEALTMCGLTEGRVVAGQKEADSLNELRRGVFARHPITPGQVITDDDVFFAFPPMPNQVLANDWSKYSQYQATQAISSDAALTTENTNSRALRQQVWEAVHRVKMLLQDGHIVVPGKSDLEISHHYGMERFGEFGMTMITVVNREYCKKLIIMLPGQTHPEQYHLKKEETFIVLHGEVHISLDGVERHGKPGDVIVVQRGVRHMFHTESGVVFEEISSTHYRDDSYYTDPAIHANTDRKTLLTYWMQT
jgi:sialic acid synthase SpsE/quercetin dioxygenase-like cupin family protein